MQRLIVVFAVLSLALSTDCKDERRVIVPPELSGQGSDRVPFSPGILQGDTLYVSGQIGADLHTRKIPSDFESEVKTCLDNIGLILKAADMDFSHVVSVQVYLTDMSLFPRMNDVYASVFKTPRPARVTVGVSALAVPDAHVEIAVIARR
jgi:2-iminobutanoate/2-iminopropanoate deaminase